MVTATGPGDRPRRRRNPRGEGHLLRRDILGAASEILKTTGTEEAVTLRRIAKAVGVSAPSIYNHFDDRAAIIDAVVAEHLASLADALTTAARSADDPAGTMLAAWAAYLDFGRDNPGWYRVIFERRFLPLWDEEPRVMTDTAPLFDQAAAMMIGLLQTCMDQGFSTSTDAFADSVAIWYLAHGIVALPTTITSFPWPDRHAHLASSIVTLGHLIQR
jgi:AcrR family transcriptional regulator